MLHRETLLKQTATVFIPSDNEGHISKTSIKKRGVCSRLLCVISAGVQTPQHANDERTKGYKTQIRLINKAFCGHGKN